MSEIAFFPLRRQGSSIFFAFFFPSFRPSERSERVEKSLFCVWVRSGSPPTRGKKKGVIKKEKGISPPRRWGSREKDPNWFPTFVGKNTRKSPSIPLFLRGKNSEEITATGQGKLSKIIFYCKRKLFEK